MSVRRKPVQEDLRNAKGFDLEVFQEQADKVRSPNVAQPDDLAPALAYIAINDGAESEAERQATTNSAKSAEPQEHQGGIRKATPGESALKTASKGNAPQAIEQRDRGIPKEGGHIRSDSARQIHVALDVAGVLDLSNSEDTTYHSRQAPAVTHETITQPVQEVKQEVINREIHEHHVHHRILPINELEILPARHFVQDAQGRRREIQESEVPGRPGRATEASQRMFAGQSKEMPDRANHRSEPRSFTAREFVGKEGDFRETEDANGNIRTEQWWIHPPTLEQLIHENEDIYPVNVDGCSCQARRP